MDKGSLRKKLAKGKHKTTVPISIRLSIETAEKLAQIEQATELNYAWWLRMLARQLVNHWEAHGDITVPLDVLKSLEAGNSKILPIEVKKKKDKH